MRTVGLAWRHGSAAYADLPVSSTDARFPTFSYLDLTASAKIAEKHPSRLPHGMPLV